MSAGRSFSPSPANVTAMLLLWALGVAAVLATIVLVMTGLAVRGS